MSSKYTQEEKEKLWAERDPRIATEWLRPEEAYDGPWIEYGDGIRERKLKPHAREYGFIYIR